MTSASSSCGCSILDTREEKFLEEESRLEIRMVCNRCGAILDRRSQWFERPVRGPRGLGREESPPEDLLQSEAC